MIDRSFAARVRPSTDPPRPSLDALLPTESLSPRYREELRSLSRERSPELYFEGLLALAGRLEAGDHVEPAAALYSHLLRQNPGETYTHRAQARLDAIVGRGSLGPRAEFLIRRLARESIAPSALIGMTAAASAFRITRLTALGALASGPATGFFSRGLGARATAGILGFTAEALTFPVATHASARLLGSGQLSSPAELGPQFASSFILLGALRLGGWGARGIGTRSSGLIPPSLLGQAGMFSGILLGHQMETALGLRPELAGATTWMDSLGLLLQFNVAGRLAQGMMGARFRRWEQAMELQTEAMGRPRAPIFNGGISGISPLIAGAGAYPSGSPISRPRPISELFLDHPLIMAMSGKGGKSGGPGENVPPTPSPTVPRGRRYISEQHILRITPEEAGQPMEISLRRFIELQPHAVLVFELPEGQGAGEVLVANSKIETLLGFTPEEAAERNILDFFNSRDSGVYSALLKKLPKEGGIHLSEIRMVRRDGSSVWCDAEGGVGDFNGRRLGFAFLEDVTARRNATEALAVSEARNEALLDAIPDAIFRLRADGTLLDLHADGFGVPHLSRERMTGVNFKDVPLPRDLIQRGLEVIQEALRTQKIQRVEYRLPMADGTVRDQEARVMASGKDEVVAIIRDITDLKRVHAERERLLQVIEASADYISMATPDGRIFFNNRAARTIMGIPPEVDLFEKNLDQLHPAWALERIVRDGISHAMAHGFWVGETALLHHEGHEVPVHQMILAHKNETGEITHFSTIIRDMTALKRAQDYRVAQGRLDTIKLMGRGLAHDGNNAVTPLDYYLGEIREFLEMNHSLLPESETRRAREALRVVDYQVDRIKGMFGRFRKLTAEPLTATPYDFHTLFANVETDLQPHLGEQIKLDLVMDPRPFRVRIPKDQMADVLQNLLVNARDAMEGREIKRVFIVTRRVSLSAQELTELVPPTQALIPQPGEFLRIRVEDTGEGMDASTLRKIFLPYFSTKRKDQGHGGIGLALVQKYIQDAGGFITVHSQVGNGTSFEIYLTRASRPRATRDPVLQQRIVETPVLIAEDEPALLRAVTASFSSHGFTRIYQASTGTEAIRLLEENPEIGFLLTDGDLLEMSGTQVVASAKRRNPRLPMILWTGRDARPYEALMNRFGGTVEKPLPLEDLIDMAESLMERALTPDPEE